MKKALTVIVILTAFVCLTGCTNGTKQSVPADNVVSAPPDVTRPPVKKAIPPPAGSATVTGDLLFNDPDRGAGSVYVFIIDEMKMPEEISVVASTIIPMDKITQKQIPFTLENVPEGRWSVIAIWDTAPPFCVVTEPYCDASTRDGIGMSETITVKKGQIIDSVEDGEGKKRIVIPIY